MGKYKSIDEVPENELPPPLPLPTWKQPQAQPMPSADAPSGDVTHALPMQALGGDEARKDLWSGAFVSDAEAQAAQIERIASALDRIERMLAEALN